MSVKCLLCNREFSVISNSHLKSVHSTALTEYVRTFPSAVTISEETYQALSASMTLERRIATSKAVTKTMTGHIVTEETRKKISLGETGKVVPKEVGQKISKTLKSNVTPELLHKMSIAAIDSSTPEVRKRISETLRETYKNNSTIAKGISASLKRLWKDPKFAKTMSVAWNRKPNNSELQLGLVLDKNFPNKWKYVGDGNVWIEGRNPDFINVEGKKQVIEMFGIFWHSPTYFPDRPTEEELVAHYKKYGFDCIIIWEYDVYDESLIIKRVDNLMNNMEEKAHELEK